MSKTLEEIRKKLQALDSRKGTGNFGKGDKTVYQHWNIPEGTSAVVRFLPDANEDNTFFWTEKQIIKLSFPGIKGHDENKPVEVQVPCIEMWDGKNTCPILNEVRPWWKDKSLEDTARKYWVKRTYYMQGFIKQDPLGGTDAPENPIRKFIIGPQIYAIIKAVLMDPELTNSPVDYVNGLDFFINKTSKGGFADYGTSKWARKESSIDEEMQDAIEKYGLVDLSTYLPKKPTEEQLAIMFEMFQASLDGELYDPEKWSQHYKPFGFDSAPSEDSDSGEGGKTSRSSPVSRLVTQSVAPKQTVVEDEDETPPFEADTPKSTSKETDSGVTTTGKSPQEILAMLRNRNK